MLTQMKEGALALALKAWLRERFGDYGEVLECAFDTDANTLRIEALLRGERESITAKVSYDLEKAGDQHFVILKKFASTRAWLTTLLTNLLKNKRYPIPGVVSKLL